jgi:hypothetical protein
LEEFDLLWRLLFNEKELLTEVLIWFEKSYLLKKTRIKTLDRLIIFELASLLVNMKECGGDVHQG